MTLETTVSRYLETEQAHKNRKHFGKDGKYGKRLTSTVKAAQTSSRQVTASVRRLQPFPTLGGYWLFQTLTCKKRERQF